MADRALSPHFNLSEFLVSQTAARQGIPNQPSALHIANLEHLANDVLEPVRALLGNNGMFISSGYRSPQLNTAVGGAPNSDHMQGQAADFTCPGFGSVLKIWELLRTQDLPFHQLIREFDQNDTGWVHISWRPPEMRQHQVMTIDPAGTHVWTA
jgi:zinc D-Ala-D-Ala carboxypeptidase